MAEKLLSIVTISYNQKQFLQQALESVAQQKADDVEYIVVDPGSNDGSRELIQSYAHVIDHIVFAADKGPADGLNHGFATATGSTGYFLNADDFLLSGAVDKLRHLQTIHPESSVTLCRAWLVDEQAKPLRQLFSKRPSLKSLALGRDVLVQQGFAFQMDLFRKVGGFNPENQSCWDRELLCAMLQEGAQCQLDDMPLAAFRLHRASLSGGNNGEKHQAKYANDHARLCELYAQQKPDTKSGLKAIIRKLQKHVAAPATSLTLMRDSLLPKFREARFAKAFRP